MNEAPARLDDLIAHVKDQYPDASALEQLSGAMQASERLNELADHLVGHFVDQARRTGASWAEIGQSLGVSKQAAQKRFVPKPSGASEQLGELLAEEGLARFTRRARLVMVRAEEEARRAGHNYIGTEHLVLGLLDDPQGLAATTIQALGIRLQEASEAVRHTLRPADPDAISGRIPFTPRTRKVVQLALREALRLGHNYIGTEHLLLAVIRERDGAAAKALAELGVTENKAETQIVTALNEIQQQRRRSG